MSDYSIDIGIPVKFVDNLFYCSKHPRWKKFFLVALTFNYLQNKTTIKQISTLRMHVPPCILQKERDHVFIFNNFRLQHTINYSLRPIHERDGASHDIPAAMDFVGHGTLVKKFQFTDMSIGYGFSGTAAQTKCCARLFYYSDLSA